MTTAELIAEMKRQDPDGNMPVVVWREDRGERIQEVGQIREIVVGNRQPGGVYPRFDRLKERNVVRVLILD